MAARIAFLAVIVILALLGVAASIIVVLRISVETDRLELIGLIVGFLAPTLIGLLAILRAENANGHQNQTEQLIQQHLTENHGPDSKPST